ncbi:hypothetical protein BH23ACT5_BH23ACT5_03130 [soil metagenome]
MAQFKGCLSTPRSPDEVYAYLADFTNATEWDPGTRQARRTDEDRFVLTAAFFGSTIDLTYSIAEATPPSRLVLDLAGRGIRGRDVITVRTDDSADQTVVSYDAEIGTTGIKRLLAPAVAFGFPSVARKALDGLADALGGHVIDC